MPPITGAQLFLWILGENEQLTKVLGEGIIRCHFERLDSSVQFEFVAVDCLSSHSIELMKRLLRMKHHDFVQITF